MPNIPTARLLLRPFQAGDAPAVRALAGDRRVAEMTATIPHPYPDGAAEAWIATHEANWELGRGLTLAMTLGEAGDVVGAIGLGMAPEHEAAELGYWVGVPFWGRGYATEAARRLVAYGFGALHLHRIHAHHFARNLASGRVLEKAGLRHEGLRRAAFRKWDRFEDLRDLGILRSDWLASGGGASFPDGKDPGGKGGPAPL